MGIKVTVNSVPKTRVSINSTERNTIRSVGLAPSAPYNELRNLTDVNATNLVDNSALVYDEASDKFVVKSLPILNGGNF